MSFDSRRRGQSNSSHGTGGDCRRRSRAAGSRAEAGANAERAEVTLGGTDGTGRRTSAGCRGAAHRSAAWPSRARKRGYVGFDAPTGFFFGPDVANALKSLADARARLTPRERRNWRGHGLDGRGPRRFGPGPTGRCDENRRQRDRPPRTAPEVDAAAGVCPRRVPHVRAIQQGNAVTSALLPWTSGVTRMGQTSRRKRVPRASLRGG